MQVTSPYRAGHDWQGEAQVTSLSVHASSTVQLTPLTPSFGAIVEGIDATRPLSDTETDQLRAAVLRYKVVLLRDQYLDAAQHHDLAAHFGPAFDSGKVSAYEEAGVTEVRLVSHFHADFMYLAEPPVFSMLQMLELPDVGGDTIWVDLDASYQALSEPMRQFLRPLTVRHVMPNYFLPDADLRQLHLRRYGTVLDDSALSRLRDALRPHEHPLVRRIPETGTVNYWISEQHTESIVELSPWESQAVLALLFRHQLRPEFVLRWRWSAGDLAFWDHRRTLHSGVDDFDGKRRGRRATVGHEKPLPAERE